MNQSADRQGSGRGKSCVILSIVCLLTSAAWAESPPQTASPIERTAMVFEIQRQPLRDALEAFVSRSGWQLVYNDRMVEGIQSDGVSGEMPPEAALAKLLSHSPFGIRMTAQRTGTLVAKASRTSEPSDETQTVAASDPLPEMEDVPIRDC